jgi:hypothetical protein
MELTYRFADGITTFQSGRIESIPLVRDAYIVENVELPPALELGAIYHVEVGARNGDFARNPVKCAADLWIPVTVSGELDVWAWPTFTHSNWPKVAACNTPA